jgi:hypothetical protein
MCRKYNSKSDLSLTKATSEFLNDFVKTGGSCEAVCDCIDPKPIKCPTFGKCCDGCVCIEGNHISGYTTAVKEGCTGSQYFNDWTRLSTQKCTTKKFN